MAAYRTAMINREFNETELEITKCNSQMLPATPAEDVSQSRSLGIIPAKAHEGGVANCKR